MVQFSESLQERILRRRSLDILWEIACYSFDWHVRELAHLLGKAGYSPNQPRVPVGNPDGGQWTGGGGGPSWARPEKFEKHYLDHHKKFGSISRSQYSSMAQEFYKEAQVKKYPTMTTKEGYTKIYDPKTNRLGVYSPRGQTETFYKPRSKNHFKNVVRDEISKGGRLTNTRISNSAGGPRGGGGGIGGGIVNPQDLIDTARDFDIIY